MAQPLRKNERIALRATDADKQLIEEAAQVKHVSASEFILEAARVKANEVLEESKIIQLQADAWNRFCLELDRPAEVIPALQEFMNEPSVLDDIQQTMPIR